MGIIAKMPDNGGDYPIAPEGTHAAVCVQVIDLGTQYSEHYGKSAHKILLGWELPDADRGSGEHAVIAFRRYTLSLHPKSALRQNLESWRGKPFTEAELDFDLAKLLGAPCLISIVHDTRDGTTYANVAAVMAMLKGAAKPKPTTDTLLFDIDKPDMAVFEKFGSNLQATIKRAEEWGDNGQPAPVDPASVKFPDDDSIPF